MTIEELTALVTKAEWRQTLNASDSAGDYPRPDGYHRARSASDALCAVLEAIEGDPTKLREYGR